MKSQLVVTAAIPCLALRGLNIGAGIYGGCYREEQCLDAEPRPMSRVKCFELRRKLDESASSASFMLKQQWLYQMIMPALLS